MQISSVYTGGGGAPAAAPASATNTCHCRPLSASPSTYALPSALAQQRDLAAKVAVRLRLRAAHSALNAWAQPSDALCSCNPASGAKVRHSSSVSAGTHH